jgi:DNA-binding ferritin-like protein
LTKIQDQTKIPRAELMVEELLADNEKLLSMWKEAFSVAEQENEQGIANFIAERIDAHGKWRWQLRSILRKDRA